MHHCEHGHGDVPVRHVLLADLVVVESGLLFVGSKRSSTGRREPTARTSSPIGAVLPCASVTSILFGTEMV